MLLLHCLVANINVYVCVLVADEVKFTEASRMGNLIPLHRCIFADHLTPVLAYRCLVKEDDREAPSFLFESVQPGLHTSSVVRKRKKCSLLFIALFAN